MTVLARLLLLNVQSDALGECGAVALVGRIGELEGQRVLPRCQLEVSGRLALAKVLVSVIKGDGHPLGDELLTVHDQVEMAGLVLRFLGGAGLEGRSQNFYRGPRGAATHHEAISRRPDGHPRHGHLHMHRGGHLQ